MTPMFFISALEAFAFDASNNPLKLLSPSTVIILFAPLIVTLEPVI